MSFRILFLFALLLASPLGAAGWSNRASEPEESQSAADAEPAAELTVEKPGLRAELLAMKEKDQRLRRELLELVQSEDGEIVLTDPAAMKAVMDMQAADRAHTERLKKIVAEHGWPTISMVGKDGSHAAWLLVQHATHDMEFMEDALERFSPLVEAGEVSPKNYAYLHDRVQMHNDRPQRYGTQFLQIEIDGVTHAGVWPMEEPQRVDEFRRAVGLGPFAEYAERNAGDLPPIPPDMTIAEIRAAQRASRSGAGADAGG